MPAKPTDAPQRAKVADMRKDIEVAHLYLKNGIGFVCVPVFDDPVDRAKFLAIANEQTDKFIKRAEAHYGK